MPRFEDSNYPRSISITGLSWICSSCLSIASGILQRRMDIPNGDTAPETTLFLRTAVSVLRSVVFMLSRHGQHMVNESWNDLEAQGQNQNLDGFEMTPIQMQLDEESRLAAFADVFLAQENDSLLEEFMQMDEP